MGALTRPDASNRVHRKPGPHRSVQPRRGSGLRCLLRSLSQLDAPRPCVPFKGRQHPEILRPRGCSLGADHVGEGGDASLRIADQDRRRAHHQILEAVGTAGMEGEVAVAVPAREVRHRHLDDELRCGIEQHAVRVPATPSPAPRSRSASAIRREFSGLDEVVKSMASVGGIGAPEACAAKAPSIT